MEYRSYTHKGTRTKNEDRTLIHKFPSGTQILGIADGMSGYEAGGEAATLALSSIVNYLKNNQQESFTKTVILKAFEFANEQIRQFRYTNLNGAKAGATIAIVLIQENTATCAWSGDCRIRYYKNQQLSFESKDHTVANEWLKQGLSANFSISEKYQQMVTRGICGTAKIWTPSIKILKNIKVGEQFILLTDGCLNIELGEDIEVFKSTDNRSLVSVQL